MQRGRKMIFNTILLTATALTMRTVAMAFQVFLSNRIGAAGIGLFQLIMSVSMLASTLAISGIRFSTTRLVSEELGRKNHMGAKAAMRRSLLYALGFGSAAMLLLWFGAELIGTRWIGDRRTVLSLRVLALSLPCFSMSSVLAGYFTAVSRITKSAAVQVIEQLVRISVIMASLALGAGHDLEHACAIVVLGGVAGEIASFLLLYGLYRRDRRRLNRPGGETAGITRRMFGIAVPLAFSAYARTALSTVQNLLVPRGLRKSGATAEMALADYGMVQGMVLPIITYPSALFYSLAELLVPELTEAQVQGRVDAISTMVTRTLRLCLLFSVGVTVILFAFSRELGMGIYGSERVGHYIRILAPLLPIMYLDSVTDGMLRGLGLQIHSMKINIFDSLVSVTLVYFLLPVFAVYGYLFMIISTEIMNFGFSVHKLSKTTKIALKLRPILLAVLCAGGAVTISVFLLRIVGVPLSPETGPLAVHIIMTAIVYVGLLLLFGCIEKADIDWFRHINGERRPFFRKSL